MWAIWCTAKFFGNAEYTYLYAIAEMDGGLIACLKRLEALRKVNNGKRFSLGYAKPGEIKQSSNVETLKVARLWKASYKRN